MIIPFDPADPITTQFQAESDEVLGNENFTTDSNGRVFFRYTAGRDVGQLSEFITVWTLLDGNRVELNIPISILQ